MAVFNTTYNFNQDRMGFGQALLYGALGSIGGGCCGGSYGMGMNGSLFSMMNMGIGGGCCGYGYSDAMMGMQFGNILSNAVYGCLSAAFAGRGGSDDVSVKTLDDYKKEAEENLPSSFDTDIKTAKSNAETASSQYKVMSEAKKRISEIPGEISKLEEQKITKGSGENGALTPSEEQTNQHIEQEIQRLNTEKTTKETERDNALNAIKSLNIKGLENITEFTSESVITSAANQAIKDAETAKNNEIDRLANELKAKDDAKIQKAEKNAERMNEINEVDGNSLSRTRASKVKDKNDNGSNDYDEDDVQGALAAFKKAKSDNDKKYWHNILHNMCQNNDLMNSINSDIAKIVKKYFSTAYKPE